MFTGSVKRSKECPRGVYTNLFKDDVYASDCSGSGVVAGRPIQHTYNGKTINGAFGFPRDSKGNPAKRAVAFLYINFSGVMMRGQDTGSIIVRAVRFGTSNDTAVKKIAVKSSIPGGALTWFHTHPLWYGADPEAFIWEVAPGDGILSLDINNHYVKHEGLTGVLT